MLVVLPSYCTDLKASLLPLSSFSDTGADTPSHTTRDVFPEDRSSNSEEVQLEEIELEQESWRPFEFRALEALLRCVTNHFVKSLDTISIAVSRNLDRVRRRTNSQALDSLRVVKTLVNELEANVNALEEALEERIRDDIGLQLMNLSVLHVLHEEFTSQSSAPASSERDKNAVTSIAQDRLQRKLRFSLDVAEEEGTKSVTENEGVLDEQNLIANNDQIVRSIDEEEQKYNMYSKLGTNEPLLLLDHYVQECEDNVNRIELLQKSIDTTEDYIRIGLDTVRNNLLKADLVFNATSVALGIGGVIAGLPPYKREVKHVVTIQLCRNIYLLAWHV